MTDFRTAGGPDGEVTALPELDLDRYLGLWYEIARLPLKWEDDSATDITAHYSYNESGTVKVDNRCIDKDGKPDQSIAEGTPVDDEPGKLTVNFLPRYLRWIPFTSGDYWVLAIDDAYSLALVGTPDHENLWILSRTPDPEQERVDAYLAEARRQGFDLDPLIVPRHTGNPVTDETIAALDDAD